jgi:hypothetical protein
MFEESRSFRGLPPQPATGAEPMVHPVPVRRGETALKAIEWCDLSARLEAARDLRVALRHEARRHIEDTSASFSDAAAQYFRTLEDAKRPVNLPALDEYKGCAPIVPGRGNRTVVGASAAAVSARNDAKDEQ